MLAAALSCSGASPSRTSAVRAALKSTMPVRQREASASHSSASAHAPARENSMAHAACSCAARATVLPRCSVPVAAVRASHHAFQLRQAPSVILGRNAAVNAARHKSAPGAAYRSQPRRRKPASARHSAAPMPTAGSRLSSSAGRNRHASGSPMAKKPSSAEQACSSRSPAVPGAAVCPWIRNPVFAPVFNCSSS